MISIPFHGSKKTSYKYVKPIVEKFNYRSVYEPFGGSGVLSVNLFKDGLVDRAVINDYDRFFSEYENYLDYKDWIVEKCYEYGLRRVSHDSKGFYREEDNGLVYIENTLLPLDQKLYLQSLINQIPEHFWKYLALGGNFCHAAVAQKIQIKLQDFRYFKAYLKTDKQREYLEWLKKLEITSLDYKEFLKIYRSEFGYDTLLIIDPPYVDVSQNSYNGKFGVEETKELIDILRELKIDFIFFNDNKELVNELLDGLNILDENDAGISSGTTVLRERRRDYFAYVKF